MLTHGEEGHVLNTASIAGVTSNIFGIYGVSKHAVVALTEYLYHSLREAGAKIGASVLCPSFVSTNLGISDRNRPSDLQNETPNAPGPAAWVNDPTVVNTRAKRIEASQAADIVLQDDTRQPLLDLHRHRNGRDDPHAHGRHACTSQSGSHAGL
jgi:NAD(P)-dependent dehydrogenase (short-subunit alcohol dehydrogenase family)